MKDLHDLLWVKRQRVRKPIERLVFGVQTSRVRVRVESLSQKVVTLPYASFYRFSASPYTYSAISSIRRVLQLSF